MSPWCNSRSRSACALRSVIVHLRQSRLPVQTRTEPATDRCNDATLSRRTPADPGSRYGTHRPDRGPLPRHGSQRAGGRRWPTLRVGREELAPVRPRIAAGDGGLDVHQQCLHGRLLPQPGEMERNGVAAVGGAQPEIVGGHGADLADLQQRCDPGRQRPQCGDHLGRAVPGDQVFGLHLVAVARGEVELEVRQPVVPRTGDAELPGADVTPSNGDEVQTEYLVAGTARPMAAALRALAPICSLKMASPQRSLVDHLAATHLVRFHLAAGATGRGGIAGGHQGRHRRLRSAAALGDPSAATPKRWPPPPRLAELPCLGNGPSIRTVCSVTTTWIGWCSPAGEVAAVAPISCGFGSGLNRQPRLRRWTMTDLKARAERLRELHHGDILLVLPNVGRGQRGHCGRRGGVPCSRPRPARRSARCWAFPTGGAGRRGDAARPAGWRGRDRAGHGRARRLSPAAEGLVDRLLEIGAVGCNLEDSDHRGRSWSSPGPRRIPGLGPSRRRCHRHQRQVTCCCRTAATR